MDHRNSNVESSAHQNTEHVEVETAPETGFQVNRRSFVGAGAAAVMGLAMTQLTTQRAEAAGLPRNNTVILPAATAAHLAPNFLASPDVKQLYDFFTAQGMSFIPERALVTVYEDPGTAVTPAQGPALLMIWPSFKSFGPGDASHEAASIIAVDHCGEIGGVLACSVVVNHNPFQIQQFDVFEIDHSTGTIGKRSADRATVKRLSAQQLANFLGTPPVDPSKAKTMPSITPTNMTTLAAGAFTEFINDSFASPLYPAGAITNLLKDAALVKKWSQAQQLRYGGLFAGITICCSTSSNACTSSSSSITINL